MALAIALLGNLASDTPVLIQHGAKEAHSSFLPPAVVQGGVYVSDAALMTGDMKRDER